MAKRRQQKQPIKIKVTAWKCRRCGAFFAEDTWEMNMRGTAMERTHGAFSRACEHEIKCIGTLEEQPDGSWQQPRLRTADALDDHYARHPINDRDRSGDMDP